MRVHFKITGGKDADLECEPEWTIAQLKEHLGKQIDVPGDNLRLVFKGRIAKLTDTLAAMKVEAGSTFHVVKTGVKPVATATAETTSSAAAATTTASQSAPPTAANANNPFAALGGLDPLSMGAAGNMFGRPGGAMPDPRMMASLMHNPQMQRAVQNIASQPEFLRSMIDSNPMLQQLAQSNPMLRQTLSNPDALREMLNPDAIRMAAQMMDQTGSGGGDIPGLSSLLGGLNPAPNSTTESAPTGAAPAPNAAASNNAAANPFANIAQMMNNPAIQQEMRRLMESFGDGAPFGGASSAPTGDTRPPSERFATEIQQLEEMGFLDKDANVTALTRSGGDVNAAIAHLLEHGFGN